MNLGLAIASGHHKSVAAILSDGRFLVAESGKSLNAHHYSENLLIEKHLGDLLQKCTKRVRLENVTQLLQTVDRASFSLPGITMEADKKPVLRAMSNLGWPPDRALCIRDDTFTGLVAGLMSQKGICVFAGVGTSVYVALDEHVPHSPPYKFDGLGPYLGDRGSGFALGIAAIEELGKSFDSRTSSLPFFDALMAAILKQQPHHALNDHRKLQAAIGHIFTRTIRQQSAILFDLARITLAFASSSTGESQLAAKALVRKAAHALGETALKAIDMHDNDARKLPIICQGSLFRDSDIYFSAFADLVRQKSISIERAQYRPLFGAAALLISTDGTVPDRTSEKLQILTQSIDTLRPIEASFVRNTPAPLPTIT